MPRGPGHCEQSAPQGGGGQRFRANNVCQRNNMALALRNVDALAPVVLQHVAQYDRHDIMLQDSKPS
eukprot:15483032-Alexandrium_andersonii.AAC.1